MSQCTSPQTSSPLAFQGSGQREWVQVSLWGCMCSLGTFLPVLGVEALCHLLGLRGSWRTLEFDLLQLMVAPETSEARGQVGLNAGGMLSPQVLSECCGMGKKEEEKAFCSQKYFQKEEWNPSLASDVINVLDWGSILLFLYHFFSLSFACMKKNSLNTLLYRMMTESGSYQMGDMGRN